MIGLWGARLQYCISSLFLYFFGGRGGAAADVASESTSLSYGAQR